MADTTQTASCIFWQCDWYYHMCDGFNTKHIDKGDTMTDNTKYLVNASAECIRDSRVTLLLKSLVIKFMASKDVQLFQCAVSFQ